MERKRILIEGWRFIPHSYAIVTQWLLLALLRRSDVESSFRDTPYCYPTWQAQRGIFPEALETAIAAVPPGVADASYDLVFRLGFPYELDPSPAKRTAVFITSEFGGIPSSHFAGRPDYAALARRDDLFIMPPSHWAAAAAYQRGFRRGQVVVLPHGVEPTMFRPMPEQRDAVRRRLGLDGFVFLNVGAMTPNKGVTHIFKAFAAVAQKRPEARLVLKGLDSLHNSREVLASQMGVLTAAERSLVLPKLLYIGDKYSMQAMAALYQAADCYLSPYRAEGFNIPVLEAAACGLPLICTAGGATDDFVTNAFCLKIPSEVETVRYEDALGRQLDPDLDQLIASMLRVMDDSAWRRSAGAAGPQHAHGKFGWDVVAEQLLRGVGLTQPE
jgi:glycosyltransferase involved in cell wall biosynthesis